MAKTKTKAKIKYYTPQKLFDLAPTASIFLIFGQRGNGKTTGIIKDAIDEYKASNYENRFVYMRRWNDDIKAFRMEQLFSDHLGDYIKEKFGEGFRVEYYRHKFYLVNSEDTKIDVLGYAISLSDTTHNKSISFEKVTRIIMDEFIPLPGEHPMVDEIARFENNLSSIIRGKNAEHGVRVFLLANTVSKYSPYFLKYGVPVNAIKPGDIKVNKFKVDDEDEIYQTVAFEYCEVNKEVSKQQKLFSSNAMITSGAWDIPDITTIIESPGEVAKEKLLFTIYDDNVDITIGCFLRNAYYEIMQLDKITMLHYPEKHRRQFLVIRTVNKKSSYFHLSTDKTLDYHNYNDINIMLSDILEYTGIDFKHELYMGRVFCDTAFTADYFYNAYNRFIRTSVRDLL